MRRKTLFTGALLTLVLLTAFIGGGYAIFTDTESMHVEFEAGKIDITLNGLEGYQEISLAPGTFDDWKPGDHMEWPITIHNKESSNKAWIQVYVFPTGPWDEGAANLWDVATFSLKKPDWWNGKLGSGAQVNLTLVVDFPLSAGNKYQGAQGDLLILVVAKQWRNLMAEGWSCVALENKDTTNWLPILSDDIEGEVCYKTDSPLELVVNAYGLEGGKEYQVTLNGTGVCTDTDEGIGGSPPEVNFKRGYWNYWSSPPKLGTTCDSSEGSKGMGVWNFGPNHPYGSVTSNTDDSLSYMTSLDLPEGTYTGVKFLIKETTAGFPSVLMETEPLNFIITTP